MPRDWRDTVRELLRRIECLERRLDGLPSRPALDIWQTRFRVDVELAGALSPGGSVSCKVMKWDGSAEGDSGETITAHDRYGMSGATGDKGCAEWKPQKGRFELEQLEC